MSADTHPPVAEDLTNRIISGEPVPLYRVRVMVTTSGDGAVICEGCFDSPTDRAKKDAQRLSEIARRVAWETVPPNLFRTGTIMAHFTPGGEIDLYQITLSLGMGEDGGSVWYPQAEVLNGLHIMPGAVEAAAAAMNALMEEVCSW